MKYKLYYTNNFGQIVKPDGELDLSGENHEAYSEEYIDIEEAKLKAKKFVNKNPIMACVISPGENGKKELIVSASQFEIDRAIKVQESDVNIFLKKIKRKKIFYYGLTVIVCVMLIVLVYRWNL